jgi:hypothetical protein
MPLSKKYRIEFCDFSRQGRDIDNLDILYIRRTFCGDLWNYQRMLMFAVSNSGNYRDFCQLPGSIMVGNYSRVKESVLLSINIQPFSLADFCGYSNFAKPIVPYLPDPLVIDQTPEALRWVLRLHNYCRSTYWCGLFSGSRKSTKALLLTLSKQGFLIPLVLILPNFLGIFECGLHSQSQIFYQRY